MASKNNSLYWEVDISGKGIVLHINQEPMRVSISLPVYLAKELGEALVVNAEVVKARREPLR
ncbi:hypothetical protein LCGC14_1566870 [marine sediment metagenome]|uniref:Uncharacterized protein n=1 Tax=marine sediment metagenome TaxID=412755 RepID=A0A0F9LLD7_9ZZZZ